MMLFTCFPNASGNQLKQSRNICKFVNVFITQLKYVHVYLTHSISNCLKIELLQKSETWTSKTSNQEIEGQAREKHCEYYDKNNAKHSGHAGISL